MADNLFEGSAITPYLITKGAEEAIAFYVDAFGAVESYRVAHGSGKLVVLLKNCRSSVTREISAVGAPSRRAAMRVSRSRRSGLMCWRRYATRSSARRASCW